MREKTAFMRSIRNTTNSAMAVVKAILWMVMVGVIVVSGDILAAVTAEACVNLTGLSVLLFERVMKRRRSSRS